VRSQLPTVALTVGCLALVAVGQPARADDGVPTGQFVLQVAPSSPAIVRNAGAAKLLISIATANGGVLRTVRGHLSDHDEAVRFPAFDPSSTGPRAVIRVTNPGGDDLLDPGKGRFEFGADIMLDEDSASKAPGSTDNGNNVLQRGLYDNPSQFKLQVDGQHATCLVKGRAGTVQVRSGSTISPDRWYRLQCVRNGDDVTLTVTSWGSDGKAIVKSTTKSGSTGDMSPQNVEVPLSVGGKLNKIGRINDETDQFNGLIENAYLDAGTVVTVPTPGSTPVVAKPSALTMHSNKAHPERGKKVRFHGHLGPAVRAAVGAHLTLSFKGKGEGSFTQLRKTRVAADRSYRFGAVVVGGRGKYRVMFTGNHELLGSRAKLKYRHRAFR
jgi:hypothetical protein